LKSFGKRDLLFLNLALYKSQNWLHFATLLEIFRRLHRKVPVFVLAFALNALMRSKRYDYAADIVASLDVDEVFITQFNRFVSRSNLEYPWNKMPKSQAHRDFWNAFKEGKEDSKEEDNEYQRLKFNSMISDCARVGDPYSIVEIVDSMKKSGLEPSFKTYALWLHATSRSKEVDHSLFSDILSNFPYESSALATLKVSNILAFMFARTQEHSYLNQLNLLYEEKITKFQPETLRRLVHPTKLIR